MDGERSDGGGEAEVEDEFACAGVLRGSLASLHGTVERIFGVRFEVGVDDTSQDNNGQIWLKLQGRRENVTAAKLFVKGVVNQEEQQEVSYPGLLHCVFCGARGLFMDSLIKSTSAHIVVGSTGFLLISGLAEPVVRAYSLIMDLVERYEGTQSRRSDTGDRGPGESLDSRRAFKTLVENWEDRHILDLLVLPGSVKEILLDLVKDSRIGSNPNFTVRDGYTGAGPLRDLEDKWDRTTDQWIEGTSASLLRDTVRESLFQSEGSSGRAEGAEGAEKRLMSSPQEVEEEEQMEQEATVGTKVHEGLGEGEVLELQSPVGNKEFLLLLKFFTAMGYTEDVVKRVLARTGPKEASQILDLVQQENDRSDRENNQDTAASNHRERNRPCETEHREDVELAAGGDNQTGSKVKAQDVSGEDENGATGTRHLDEEARDKEKEDSEEDFVLGVVKKAAASCGYMEQNVAKVYNKLHDGSTHQLILELQREEGRDAGAFREGPREMDDVVLEKEGPKVRPAENKAHVGIDLFRPAEKREPDVRGWVELPNPNVGERDLLSWLNKPQQPPTSQKTSHQIILPDVKGPPKPTYSSSLDPPLTNFQTNKPFGQTNTRANTSAPKPSQPNHDNVSNPKSHSSTSFKRGLQAHTPSFFARTDSSPNRTKERRGVMAPSPVVVTGEQRFLEGLQASFDLQLTDKPGDPKLRTIIIDGSNVAMSHGLSLFFSCRGIALAVQHFWDRGHRHISALLPQWRQKSDPRIKEKHYLTELQNLGLVSYTPSREVQGKRISSYDDRFMLQHAQKTDGVIVTNDNLRDLSDESAVWRDIIKKRLLQYTFVGDHFMVPDDPLGRGGPHLDDFLRSEHRTPDPGNHSFAGTATTFPSFKTPRSQTEVLNFRDRTTGGALDVTQGGNRGKGQGKGQRDRSLEETGSLREQLCQVFLGQDNMVALVLQSHPSEMDVNVLSDMILQQQAD
ncbi:protein KHNYN isoform X2 [Labrus mixtus]|uniref:protein KHNYN isoform X2 n=1 Tax=Labrus mixtus TaxID=508554 RepID=UPI0029BFC252|nr:protein KHNYN isoform X2 [Labrus mixtus]